MGPFEMVVAIVAITMVAGVIRAHLKTRTPAALPPEQDARLVKLEQRVQALEAVVGDKSYELKEKFRELEK